MTGRVLPSGRTALLVEVADLEQVLAFTDLVSQDWPGVVDVIPAARTVLVKVASEPELPSVRARLGQALNLLGDSGTGFARNLPEVEIPVVYDGPDVAEVAELVGLSMPELIAAHTGHPWRVAFGGFAPGFAYLVGGDPRLEVPRRVQPRTVVPAGAVGLAGVFSGVYPRSSPGGWQIIGHTEMSLWDENREPPALLRPGWRVQFVEVS